MRASCTMIIYLLSSTPFLLTTPQPWNYTLDDIKECIQHPKQNDSHDRLPPVWQRHEKSKQIFAERFPVRKHAVRLTGHTSLRSRCNCRRNGRRRLAHGSRVIHHVVIALFESVLPQQKVIVVRPSSTWPSTTTTSSSDFFLCHGSNGLCSIQSCAKERFHSFARLRQGHARLVLNGGRILLRLVRGGGVVWIVPAGSVLGHVRSGGRLGEILARIGREGICGFVVAVHGMVVLGRRTHANASRVTERVVIVTTHANKILLKFHRGLTARLGRLRLRHKRRLLRRLGRFLAGRWRRLLRRRHLRILSGRHGLFLLLGRTSTDAIE
mmetsp:Transcript_25260/g.45698  ORF Transcript_25260/g.45698 Transcript_25260/m.45698 type:complete len:325 (-) Transcript_25260:301-1275(-)